MKKLIFSAVVVAMTMASCAKDRTCTCTTTNTSSTGVVTIEKPYVYTLVKTSKASAKDNCANSSGDYVSSSTSVTTINGGTPSTSTNNQLASPSKTECKLK
jgi:hypothetical protein